MLGLDLKSLGKERSSGEGKRRKDMPDQSFSHAERWDALGSWGGTGCCRMGVGWSPRFCPPAKLSLWMRLLVPGPQGPGWAGAGGFRAFEGSEENLEDSYSLGTARAKPTALTANSLSLPVLLSLSLPTSLCLLLCLAVP